MAYSNKAYVAFDADNDIRYYRLMQAWRKVDGTGFGFFDAHDLNNLMPFSSEETIKAKLRDRMTNTKVFVLLVGNNTKYLYKFVRWEIEQAINRGIPIVVVNTNKKRKKDVALCPAILNGNLTLHVSFNKSIVAKSLREWPELHLKYLQQNKSGDYFYNESIYQNLGL